MNEEGKEVTVEFLMNHLAVEDGNTQHKFLSQINSSSSVNMIAYDHRQNRGKSNKPKQPNRRNGAQNKSRVQTSSSTAQPCRKPPGMEGKCMRCGKPEHQQEQKCAAKNAKCKECYKIVNHIGTTSGSQEKHLKFPIDVNPRGPYKDHLVVRVDTGADVNCMNEKTFRRLFPKVKLSVCPYEIQNFWKLDCRYFYTGSVSHILAVQGRKVSEHFYSHQRQ